MVTPDSYDYQDKRHMFTMAGEHHYFKPGETRKTIQWKGWRIFPQVCYDLRFPVWSRNNLDYDVLIYVANWPKSRIAHWGALLKARAIENQSYTLAVNRVGEDGKGIEYDGHSQWIDPYGNVKELNVGETTIMHFELNRNELTECRNKLPFLADRDSFQLNR